MTIDKFKTIAKNANAAIYLNNVYMLDHVCNDNGEESFVIRGRRIRGHYEEDIDVIRYDEIKSVKRSRKTKEYVILSYNKEWDEYWEISINLLTVK